MTIGLLVIPVTRPAVGGERLDSAAAALVESFTLRAENARQEGAEARLRGAKDAFMPTVAVLADAPLSSRIRYSPEIAPTVVGLDVTPRAAPYQLGLVADLPLFDGFRRLNTLRAVDAQTDAGRALVAGKRQQVLLDASIAVLSVMRDTQILEFRDAQCAAIGRILDATERQLAVGDATRTDAALARSRLQAAEAERERARSDLAASRATVVRLTGMDPERVAPPRLPGTLPRTPEAYEALVRTNNPGLIAARLGVQSDAARADAVTADLLPSVNLQVSRISQFGYSAALDRITDTTTRLLARIPLYEPGAFPRVAEASAAARQRGYEVQDIERTTLSTARVDFLRHKTVAEQAARLYARVVALRQSVKGMEIERVAGFRTIFDALNLRAELGDAEAGAAAVAAERDALSLALAAAAGLLDVDHPGAVGKRARVLPRAASRVAESPLVRSGVPPLRGSHTELKPAPEPVLRLSRIDPADAP
ncbi:TolC family protein [Methylobacterium sp. 1973]|uniref:TolC family protein n=1 Tax=Methylobacterium sp. 1973 TaxID=3156421 RepID=UPI00339A9F8F